MKATPARIAAARRTGFWVGRILGLLAIGASFVVAGFLAHILYLLLWVGWNAIGIP